MSKTDVKIITTTINCLIKEGKFDVTTQEIAEQSGSSRTVIHYYFRSRERLMDIVFQKIIDELVIERYNCLFQFDSLKEKVQWYIDESSKILHEYPYLDIYIITNFDKAIEAGLYNHEFKTKFLNLQSEILKAINRKEIACSSPLHFLTDLFSLSAFPYLFFDHLTKIGLVKDDKKMDKILIEQRKTILRKLFIN